MRRAFSVVIIVVLAFGLVALLVPAETHASKGKGPRCKYICDPPSYPPPCGQCEEWDSCGPKCGCRKIPGCKL